MVSCFIVALLFLVGSIVRAEAIRFEDCNLFQGNWVYDESYPLYNASRCPFIQEDDQASRNFDCLKNGRPDHDYLKYRWQPNDCDLPQFNGRAFLERHRNKKIMFIGDLMSKTMFLSLTCMLHAAAPKANYSFRREAKLLTFYIKEYNVTIKQAKSPFLVDLVDDAKLGKILNLSSIDSSSGLWLGMDILIYHTYASWFQTGPSQKFDYFQVENKLVKEMDRMEALRMGLLTWARWSDGTYDPESQSLFFLGITALHYNSQSWNQSSSKGCEEQTKPLPKWDGPLPDAQGNAVLEDTLLMMIMPPQRLNINYMTQLRRDGHPSVYTNTTRYGSDCTNWCLAGVPDSWNNILSTLI